MWDVDYQMAVAQAEVEDRELAGAYHDVEFGVEGEETGFVISTTRPELMPACVGVTAHPEDERYKSLFGKRAISPLFRVPVPIFPSDKADPEKGKYFVTMKARPVLPDEKDIEGMATIDAYQMTDQNPSTSLP